LSYAPANKTCMCAQCRNSRKAGVTWLRGFRLNIRYVLLHVGHPVEVTMSTLEDLRLRYYNSPGATARVQLLCRVVATSRPSCWRMMVRSRRKWKEQVYATQETCVRIDNSASNHTPRSHTTIVGLMTHWSIEAVVLSRCYWDRFAAEPNHSSSVLIALSCKRLTAHYAATETLHVISDKVTSYFMTLGYVCGIFAVVDEDEGSQLSLLLNATLWFSLRPRFSCVSFFIKLEIFEKTLPILTELSTKEIWISKSVLTVTAHHQGRFILGAENVRL